VVFPAFCFTQPPDTVWTRIFGGWNDDIGYEVKQLSDGGYIIACQTYSFGASIDGYLIRTDEYGETIWTRRYGGADHDGIHSLEITPDGGFIMAGYTHSYGSGNSDVYLIKTDSLGDVQWTRTYGGDTLDVGKCVRQTPDGGYIVAGSTVPEGASYEDMYLIKTTAIGDTIWTRTYGDTFIDCCNAVEMTSDGGYILVGRLASFILLVKVDSIGSEIWSHTYGQGVGNEGYAVVETTDGGFIVTGRTKLYLNGPRVHYLFRTDQNGDTLWTSMGGYPYDNDLHTLVRTLDNAYIAAGGKSTGSLFITGDIYVIKFDGAGNYLWESTYDVTSFEYAYSIQRTVDDGYIITGLSTNEPLPMTDYDILLLKLTPELGIHEHKNIAVGDSDFGPTVVRGPLLLPLGKKCKVFDITGRQVNVNRMSPGIYFIASEGRITEKVIKVE
jgi:hypothetical protein